MQELRAELPTHSKNLDFLKTRLVPDPSNRPPDRFDKPPPSLSCFHAQWSRTSLRKASAFSRLIHPHEHSIPIWEPTLRAPISLPIRSGLSRLVVPTPVVIVDDHIPARKLPYLATLTLLQTVWYSVARKSGHTLMSLYCVVLSSTCCTVSVSWWRL